jgi:hypothetical protein
MSFFDKIKTAVTGKPTKAGLSTEVGSSGTNISYGISSEDFNSKFNGTDTATICDKMRKTDATVSAVLKAIKLPILAAEKTIVPVDESKEEQDIAEEVSRQLLEELEGGFDNFLREALTYQDFGHSAFEKVYTIQEGTIALKKLAPRVQSSIYRWAIGDLPTGSGITQILPTTPEEREGMTTTPEIPMWKLVVFVNEKEGDNWQGISILRSAYKHWFFKDTLYRIDGIKHERGAGVLEITLPDGSNDNDMAQAQELGKNFKMNESSYIIKPSSEWKINMLSDGIKDQSSALVSSIQHHDTMIVKNVLAQFLNLGEGKTGSFALSKDQSSFFLLSLESIANYMEDIINKTVVEEIVRLNFGERDSYPKFSFSSIAEIDIEKMSTTLEKLINSNLVAVTDKMKVWTHKNFGLPELTPEDIEQIEEEQEEKQAQIDEQMKKKPEKQEKGATKEPDEENIEEDKEEKMAEYGQKKKIYKPYRELTLAEQRVKFAELDSFFTTSEGKIEQELAIFSDLQVQKVLEVAENAINEGNTGAIKDISLPSDAKLRSNVKAASKLAYEEGKRTAANELDIALPSTPKTATAVRNAKVDLLMDKRAEAITGIVKSGTLTAISAGIGATAAIHAIKQGLDSKLNNINRQVSGKVAVGSLNNGRSLVFDSNRPIIHGLQRSELLDFKTCSMCLSLDGRVVAPTDPFAKIDQIHTSCRGIWVAVVKTDAELPKVKTIPKSLLGKFETIEGVPSINNFKNLKKPLITKKSRLQQKIDDGKIENPNIK